MSHPVVWGRFYFPASMPGDESFILGVHRFTFGLLWQPIANCLATKNYRHSGGKL
jgi:hypothetical protein